MRTGREQKPPAQQNISISISVNLRKQSEDKRFSNNQQLQMEQRDLVKGQKGTANNEQQKLIKGKIVQSQKHPYGNAVMGPSGRQPKSSRTFSQAPQTVRVKTAEAPKGNNKNLKLLTQQTKKKKDVRMKQLSNDKIKRRKNSVVNKSVENLPWVRINKSISKTPIKSSISKSKSKSASNSKSSHKPKRKRIRIQIEDRYINTFENDGAPQKGPVLHKLPLQQVEHLVSKYRKQPSKILGKHSTSVETGGRQQPSKGIKRKGHRKNPTLEEKLSKKTFKTKPSVKESVEHQRVKERKRSKSAKTSFIAPHKQANKLIDLNKVALISNPIRQLQASAVKIQAVIRAYLSRRQIERWRKSELSQLNQYSAEQAELQEQTYEFGQHQSSSDSLKTIENFDQIRNWQNTELVRMIQGLEKQSKGHPLQKQLGRIVEEAKKREEKHMQILKENEKLRAMVETSRHRLSSEQQQQKEQLRQTEELKIFKQQYTNKMSRLTHPFNMEMLNIEAIDADNQQAEERQSQKQMSATTPVSISGVASPRNLISLLKEKERSLGDKHQKEIQVLTRMLQKELVSPKTYKTKLTALDHLIEQEKYGLERSKKEAERLAKFIKTIRNDREEIDKLDNVCKKELWNDARQLVMDIAVPKSELKTTLDTELLINTSIDRSRVDKIFNTFSNQFEAAENQKKEPPTTSSNQHIQIINMEEDYYREKTQNTQRMDRGQPTDANITNVLPSFKTDIYFIKQYCTSLCQYLLEDNYLRVMFLANIQSPIKYNNQEFLSWYRLNTSKQQTRVYNSFKAELIYPYFKMCMADQMSKAISKQMFAMFNVTFEDLRINDPETDSTTAELQMTFLESVLAALNQSFDFQRPCSDKGESEPWATIHMRPKYLGINALDEEEYLIMCARAINRLIDWATFYCGTMTEHVTYQNSSISQEQQQKIRDTRLTFMMERTVLVFSMQIEETQKLLLDLEPEITEAKLEISEVVFEALVQELLVQGPLFNRSSTSHLIKN